MKFYLPELGKTVEAKNLAEAVKLSKEESTKKLIQEDTQTSKKENKK